MTPLLSPLPTVVMRCPFCQTPRSLVPIGRPKQADEPNDPTKANVRCQKCGGLGYAHRSGVVVPLVSGQSTDLYQQTATAAAAKGKRPRRKPGDPPYRLLFASPCWHRGGLEAVTLTHLRQLDRSLFDPYLLVGEVHYDEDRDVGDVPLTIDRPSFEFDHIPPRPQDFSAALVASKAQLEALKPDILLGGLTHAAHFSAADLDVPVIAEYHHIGWSWDCQQVPSDLIISVSRNSSRRMESTRRPKVPIHVVYNGVDEALFQADDETAQRTRRELGFAEGDAVVGFCGRISAEKDPLGWVEAVAKLKRAFPQVRGFVLGEPWNRGLAQKMQERAAARGLQWGRDVLQLSVTYREVPRHLAAMDVLLHMRRDEPFGMVLPEALLVGTPVVAYNSAGPKEIAEALGKPEGLALALHGKFEDLVETCKPFCESPRRVPELRAPVIEKFGAARMTRELEAILLAEIEVAKELGHEA